MTAALSVHPSRIQMKSLLHRLSLFVLVVSISLLLILSKNKYSIHAFTFHPHSRATQHQHTTSNGRLGLELGLDADEAVDIGNNNNNNNIYNNSNSNSNNDSSNNISMNRRKAFMTIMATATAATTVASANAANANVDTLEDITIGKGIWTNQNDIQSLPSGTTTTTTTEEFANNDMSLSSSLSMSIPIPTNFITYMTRFLINYDTTIHDWWYNDIEYKYSLLALPIETSDDGSGNANVNVNVNTDNNNSKSKKREEGLKKNFSSLAKSIEISLFDYIVNDTGSSSSDINSDTIRNPKEIKSRFEALISLFIESYVMKSNKSNENENEIIKQTILLFTMLPREYQPMNGLNKLSSLLTSSTSKIYTTSGSSSGSSSRVDDEEYNQKMTKLLPTNIYTATYDTPNQSYTITPPIPYSSTTTSTTTASTNNNSNLLFGSIAPKPLKRTIPNLSSNTYALFGLCGAVGCTITHSFVIPFDVVKTKLQTNPNQYDNIIDGVIQISKEENGLQSFLLGSQATIVGYFWYGLSVYPTYSFSKWYLEHNVFDPPSAILYMNFISLIAGSIAAVVASVGLTPIEAARIRTVANPSVYRELGLIGSLKYMAKEDETAGWKTLYAGFPSLVTRQVIFGSVKFLAFERACEALFVTFPSLRETTATALGVSLVAGALSGALSSVVSQPADSILTYVAKNKIGGDDGDNGSSSSSSSTSVGVIEGGMYMVEKEGIGSLFRGLGSRCIWATAIISGQFFLYDIFRSMLGIGAEDLTQVFKLLLSSE